MTEIDDTHGPLQWSGISMATNGQNFSPSILPCDGVTIGWAVDETDVDSNQWRSIRGHHLSANDTSVAVYRQRNVTKKKISFSKQQQSIEKKNTVHI